MENLDIGAMPSPRPRTIFVEPLKKRARKMRQMSSTNGPNFNGPVNYSSASERTSSEPPTPAADATPTPTPTPAESSGSHSTVVQHESYDQRSIVSAESVTSGSAFSLRMPDGSRVNNHQYRPASPTTMDQQTITVTVELLKAGCLPGELLPLRITVQHTKAVKSVHGVIVTLSRIGKIDPNPPVELFRNGNSSGRSGTFGRSRNKPTHAESSRDAKKFRKDLSQSIAPLIINPVTMDTSVNLSVKVPEDCFPTIRHVPGDMLRFTYHLEIIVDLGGRLAKSFRGGVSSAQSRFGNAVHGISESGQNWAQNTHPSHIIETEEMARERGLAVVSFEVIVGTRNSRRNAPNNTANGQPSQAHAMQIRGNSTLSEDDSSRHMAPPDESSRQPIQFSAPTQNGFPPPTQNGYFVPPLPHSQVPQASSLPVPYDQLQHSTIPPPFGPAPDYIPPPTLPGEQNLSEKERARRAEERLLPSQPPESGPSEPGAGLSSSLPPPFTHFPVQYHHAHADDNAQAGPSAPTADVVEAPPPPALDKEEREMQRMRGEASAPPEVPGDVELGRPDAAASAPEDMDPSAPVLTEEDEYGDGYAFGSVSTATSAPQGHLQNGQAPSEALPRYEG